MKNRILVIFLLLLCAIPTTLWASDGADRRIGFKVEWGYSQSFFYHHRYGITSIEGYRIYDKTTDIKFNPNGRVLIGAHYQLSNKIELSLQTGYLGAQEGIRAIPLIAQAKYFPIDAYHDGFFTQIEAGAALHISQRNNIRVLPIASIGEGYHVILSPEHSLDVVISLSSFYDKPNIANPDGAGYIQKARILSNHAIYSAVNICICLNF